MLTKIKTVDGAGSGLDADLLDGQSGAYYTNYADTAIANLVDSSPATLDTLNELAAALGDDPNFATTVSTNLGNKVDKINITGATVGSASAIPVITFNAQGQITSTTTAAVDIPGSSDNVRFNSFGVGTNASGTGGQIRATNSIVAYYSDARLKDFEGTIPNALDKVMQINGYIYTGNARAGELGYDMDVRQVGVSAQEIEAVMPEVIEEAPINDTIESGEKDYKTVQYDRIVALLIEAIKEQQAQIEELKAKI